MKETSISIKSIQCRARGAVSPRSSGEQCFSSGGAGWRQHMIIVTNERDNGSRTRDA